MASSVSTTTTANLAALVERVRTTGLTEDEALLLLVACAVCSLVVSVATVVVLRVTGGAGTAANASANANANANATPTGGPKPQQRPLSASPKIPDHLFKDHAPLVSRGSASNLRALAPVEPSSPLSTSRPSSPKSPSGRSLSFFRRERGDSAAGAGAGAGTATATANASGATTTTLTKQTTLRKVTLPDNVDDIDVDLRVQVAPWVVQDESLARPLQAFVEGQAVHVVKGEAIDLDVDPDDAGNTAEDEKTKLRVKVAPWIAQADAPDDDADAHDGDGNGGGDADVASGSAEDEGKGEDSRPRTRSRASSLRAIATVMGASRRVQSGSVTTSPPGLSASSRKVAQ